MAQVALRIVSDEIDTSLVRRLMARPLRVVTDATSGTPNGEVPAESGAPIASEVAAGASGEVSRLKAEVMVMKAVLGAERREAEHLRACIARIEEDEQLTPEAQIVRDRWAALVDTLLQVSR